MKSFLIQFAGGFLANLLTALFLYVLIDRRIRQKEHTEQERAEAVRTRENANIQRATLLQQFPPLMQRLVDIQRDAFASSLLSCDKAEATASLRTLASNLRHFANVHLDTVTTLASLGADVEEMNHNADLTNQIAVISLRLVRNLNVEDLPTLVKWSLRRIDESHDPRSRGMSHLERMHILLADIDLAIGGFSNTQADQRHTLFCALAEAIGHNTNLLLELVNAAFDRELSVLRLDNLPSDSPEVVHGAVADRE